MDIEKQCDKILKSYNTDKESISNVEYSLSEKILMCILFIPPALAGSIFVTVAVIYLLIKVILGDMDFIRAGDHYKEGEMYP